MDNSDLFESFSDFARRKNIDRPTMIRILEEVFRTILRKKYGSDTNFDVTIDVDKGDVQIWRYRTIVDNNAEDFDENTQIRLSDAKKIEADFEIGENVADAVPIDFGRRGALTAKQTLIQKVRDIEKNILFEKYKDQVGEVLNCEVYQAMGKEAILHDSEGNELSLPRAEQIPKDRFRKGDSVRAIVHRVEMVNGNPKIIMSRTAPMFLEKLFEAEVPEIEDGVIIIRGVVREPGERAKVAVESYDDRIDPVGACVGIKGSRIHGIVRELQNESIDVVNYTANQDLLIQRALSPAKINNIKVDAENHRASVYLDRDQVSLAIGKNGLNIKLASKLVGLAIDVFRELADNEEEEEDVELSEFTDAIDEWIIEELNRIGLDTAKSVLAVSREDLVRRTELEEETVDFILDIFRKEFE